MIYRRLRRLRPWVQAAALLGFLTLVLATRRDVAPPIPVDLFFRLDPLAALASMIAARAWIAPLALALVTLAVTVVAGRVWCGWLCPLGTVLDALPLRKKSGPLWVGPVSRWRLLKYALLLALLAAALAGSLILLALDPITLLTRSLAGGLLPLLNLALLAVEKWLYAVPFLQPPIEWFEVHVRSAWLPVEQPFYWPAVPLVVLLVAIVVLNRIAPRFWCRVLCPLGALLGLLSKVALLRRTVSDGCSSCRRCVRACPTGTIDPARSFYSDPAECTVCLDCVVDCPQEAARFALQRLPAARQRYDPTRRQMLAALAAGAGGAALLAVLPRDLIPGLTAPLGPRLAAALIRPPGAQGPEFWARCIRCGECVKICPTSGLQPAWWQAGLEGWGTPVLVPRTGYCDYSCHSCGQVCPTDAIPALTLDQKRQIVIGVAAVDQDLCLPWSQATPCIVCEEMCPLPDKAIELEEAAAVDAQGLAVVVQRPHVIPERCIGCGICENRCPLDGVAAIRVARSP